MERLSLYTHIHTYIYNIGHHDDAFFDLFDVLQRWVETIMGIDGRHVIICQNFEATHVNVYLHSKVCMRIYMRISMYV
jgi:hypothetical protein